MSCGDVSDMEGAWMVDKETYWSKTQESERCLHDMSAFFLGVCPSVKSTVLTDFPPWPLNPCWKFLNPYPNRISSSRRPHQLWSLTDYPSIYPRARPFFLSVETPLTGTPSTLSATHYDLDLMLSPLVNSHPIPLVISPEHHYALLPTHWVKE